MARLLAQLLFRTGAVLAIAAGGSLAACSAKPDGVPAAVTVTAETTESQTTPPLPATPAADAASPSPELPPPAGAFAAWYVPVNAVKTGFGTWQAGDEPVEARAPNLAPAVGLSNVTNLDKFTLSDPAKHLLESNGFVVVPARHLEFFNLYETNRYAFTPNFVTTDAMLHEYHILFDHLLENVERGALIGEARMLTEGMLEASEAQLEQLNGTEWEIAARRNVAYFAVARKLLDPAAGVPEAVEDLVAQELALIDAHAGPKDSPIMNHGQRPSTVIDTPAGGLSLDALKEDYSQYVPRGHYDKDPQLSAYFKAMMWYGRMTFRVKNTDETRSTLLMTLALEESDNLIRWNRIYEPTVFFVGKSDDITALQTGDIAARVYGPNADPTADEAKFASFAAELRLLDPPQINSMPIFNADIQPDREEEIKGFRFMGQRFTVDAGIHQRLVYRDVGALGERMLPKALDIPAALGSDEALGLLEAMGDTKLKNYSRNMQLLRAHLAGLPESTWTQNLYWGWMHALRTLVGPAPEGYPWFMQNAAWTRKQLLTFLGSWTELKHDTILYAKQVYSELGGGGPEPTDDRGYVEPNPELYGRLAALMRMTREGLAERGMLAPQDRDSLERMERLSDKLREISVKELRDEALSDADYETIRSFGGQLEHIWLEVNKEAMARSGMSDRDYLNENPAPIVADIATDPNGEVLEEGTGYGWSIYVLVPVDGKLRISSGVVYSQYEFPWPLSDRLTDKRWREMLDSETAPPPHAWTSVFTAPK